jgi:hypothetical protein
MSFVKHRNVKVRGPRQNLRKQNGTARRSSAMIPRPPPINGYEVKHNKTLRFIATSAIAQGFTFQNLLDTILFTSSAVAPYDLFYMVRLRRVKCWALPIIGSATTVTVVFDGVTAGSLGDRQIHTDASMGIEPAFVNAAPQSKSLASLFQVSSSAVAFILDCPTGSVIDVQLEFHSETLGTAVAAQNASVASIVGVIGYRGLDGLAVATSKFAVPTGLIQI